MSVDKAGTRGLWWKLLLWHAAWNMERLGHAQTLYNFQCGFLRASKRLGELVRPAVNADWAPPRAAGEDQAVVCLAEVAHAWQRVRIGLGSLFPLFALVTSLTPHWSLIVTC